MPDFRVSLRCILANAVLVTLLFQVPGANAQQTSTQATPRQSIIRYDAIHHPEFGQKGMVVSQREVASQIGAQILARGGNAVDAAVGVGFALAVALPRAGNIGGGGFMLVHEAKTGKTISIDFRDSNHST